MIKFTKAEQGNAIKSPTKNTNPSPYPKQVEKRRAKDSQKVDELVLEGGENHPSSDAAPSEK